MLFEVLLDCLPSILRNPVTVLGSQTGQAAAKPEEQSAVHCNDGWKTQRTCEAGFWFLYVDIWILKRISTSDPVGFFWGLKKAAGHFLESDYVQWYLHICIKPKSTCTNTGQYIYIYWLCIRECMCMYVYVCVCMCMYVYMWEHLHMYV